MSVSSDVSHLSRYRRVICPQVQIIRVNVAGMIRKNYGSRVSRGQVGESFHRGNEDSRICVARGKGEWKDRNFLGMPRDIAARALSYLTDVLGLRTRRVTSGKSLLKKKKKKKRCHVENAEILP